MVAYTGHHRLARHILREVVMRYLGRDPLAMQALYQLRGVAGQLARAISALDLERFGTLVNQAWLLNKTLDPQTSYPAIERLFSALAPHVYGAKLVGAGGGGFLVAVTPPAGPGRAGGRPDGPRPGVRLRLRRPPPPVGRRAPGEPRVSPV